MGAFASAADLPEDIRKALPDEAQRLFVRVFNGCVNSGNTDPEAFKVAWKGVENAGYKKTGDKYERVAKAKIAKQRSGDLHDVALSIPFTCVTATRVEKKGEKPEIQIFGWFNTALDENGTPFVDHGDERVRVPSLERCAYAFVRKSRKANAFDHYTETCGEMIESVFLTPKKRVAMGLDGTGPTGWWGGVAVPADHPAAEAALLKQLNEFSVEGAAYKIRAPDGVTDLEFTEIEQITLVDLGEGKNVHVALIQKRRESPTAAVPQPVRKQMDQALMEQVKAACGDELFGKLEAAIMAMSKPAEKSADEKKAEELAAKKRGEEIETLRSEVAKHRSDADAAKAKAEENEKKLNAEIAIRKQRDRLDMASKLPMLGKPEEVAKKLERLEQLPTADYEVELKDLQKQNAQLVEKARRDGTEIGSGRNNNGGDSPYEQLQAIAKQLQGTDPKLSAQSALDLAIKNNPALYAEHVEKRRGARA